MKKKVKTVGLAGLLRTSRSSPRKIAETKATLIATLYKEQYPDFNILHFKDKLAELHHIYLSYESIRKTLIANYLHSPKKKR